MICRVLLPHMDHHREIRPHPMILPYMLLEALSLRLKREAINTAYEAGILHVRLL